MSHADVLSAAEHEAAFAGLYDVWLDAPFDVKTTEAREILTVDNHADGPYLWMHLLGEDPVAAARCFELLTWNVGGRFSSAVGIGDIDPQGDVHPDQFWQSVTLGNVKERPFSEIWTNPANDLLVGPRDRLPRLKGRCGTCRFKPQCGGNFRVRAHVATGDPWEADPACYLPMRKSHNPRSCRVTAAAVRGLIGPNAISRTIDALRARLGDIETEALLRAAGLAQYFREPPAAMVPEFEVAVLFRTLQQRLGEARTNVVARDAGQRTADYLLAHRIPGFAQFILRLLPPRLACRGAVRRDPAQHMDVCRFGQRSAYRGPAGAPRDRALSALRGSPHGSPRMRLLFRRVRTAL